MRLIFMGTPGFAVPPLQALLKAGHEVCAVYSQPPRPARRGQKPQKSPVQALAEPLGIPVRTPKTLKNETESQAFAALKADVAIVTAYGLLLPQEILEAPAKGCLNIHASLLPRWRGAAPIQRALAAGDRQTGISIMQMTAGLDTGPVLLSHSVAIDPLDTAGSLHDTLAALGATAIVEALANLDTLAGLPQPQEGVTYAAKIDKAETRIDWTQDPALIARKICAFSPFPGAWFDVNGERIKVLSARASPKGRLNIRGVELLELQRAGKRAQSAEEFARGFPIDLLSDF